MFSISKGNQYIAVAVAVLGVTLTAGRPAIAETMLNEYTVRSMGIAQVGGSGQCLAVVTVNSGAGGADEVRVVADNKGAVRLYSGLAAFESVIKNCRVDANTVFTIKREAPVETITSPVKELIALHKDAVKDGVLSTAAINPLEVERATAQGLGWDALDALSLKRKTYDSMVSVLASLDEVKTKAAARQTAYATQLQNAGINPATYLPLA